MTDCAHNNREYTDVPNGDGTITVLVRCVTCGTELGSYKKA